MTMRLHSRQWVIIAVLLFSATQTVAKTETVDRETLYIYWDGDLEYTPQCSSGRGLVTSMTPVNVPITLNLSIEFEPTPSNSYRVRSQLTNRIDGTRAIEQYTNEGFAVSVKYLCHKYFQ